MIWCYLLQYVILGDCTIFTNFFYILAGLFCSHRKTIFIVGWIVCLKITCHSLEPHPRRYGIFICQCVIYLGYLGTHLSTRSRMRQIFFVVYALGTYRGAGSNALRV